MEFTIDLAPTDENPKGKQPLVSVSVKDLKKSFSFQPKSGTSPIKIISLDPKPTKVSVQGPLQVPKPKIRVQAPVPEVKIKEEPIEVKKEPMDITDDPLAAPESMTQVFEDQVKVEIKMEIEENNEFTVKAANAIELDQNPLVMEGQGIKPKRGRPRKNSLEVRKSFDEPPAKKKEVAKKDKKVAAVPERK